MGSAAFCFSRNARMSFPTDTSQRFANAQDAAHLLVLRAATQKQRAALSFWRVVLLILELSAYFLVGYGLSALCSNNALLK